MAGKIDSIGIVRLYLPYTHALSSLLSVGLSEEEAISRHGDNGIEILHAKYDTLELQASHRMDHEGKPLNAICYTKVIYKRGVCSDKDRVIGGMPSYCHIIFNSLLKLGLL